MKDGKYSSNPCRSSLLSSPLVDFDLNYMCLVRLTTSDKLDKAFSSIDPTEL